MKRTIFKKLISILICFVVVLAFVGCTTHQKGNDNDIGKPIHEVIFFDGSQTKWLSVPSNYYMVCDLAENLLEYSMYFDGWVVNDKVQSVDEQLCFVVNENCVIKPQMAIDFTQCHPTDVNYADSIQNIQNYADIQNIAKPSFVLPGLTKNENSVVQGVAFVPELNYTLISAYAWETGENHVKNSVIYVLDMAKQDSNGNNGKLIKTIILFNQDNTSFFGHVGGLAATKNNIFVCGSSCLYRLPLSVLDNDSDLIFASFEQQIPMPVNASYCFVDGDGVLWVGEFCLEQDNYHTEQSHKTTINGNSLSAWTVGFKLDESAQNGYDIQSGFKQFNDGEMPIPDYVLWHGDKIQGVAVTPNKVILSESYGRKNNSHWFVFNNPTWQQPNTYVQIQGHNIPAWYLIDTTSTLTLPPMSEDLAIINQNGTDYLLFVSESASTKYRNGDWKGFSTNPTAVAWMIDLNNDLLYGVPSPMQG